MALGSVAALVVVLAAVAGGYYYWFASSVDHRHRMSSTTTTIGVDPPESTDILVLGADRRPDESGEGGRSDTLMLVHVDKEKDYLSILSLPRDLFVDIDGHGMNRLNAAYALGGPELTESTVERLTGVNIEKIVIVDFEAFSDLTDAIGGVYIDVDRSYNSQDPQFELISLHPGYQLLKGSDALDYVRFRHDDEGDFGRMLRQQRFINAARDQAMGWGLVADFNGMVKALLDNTTVYDLSAPEILSLAWWGVHLQGSQIKQVSLIGDIVYREIAGARASVVVATEEAIGDAVEKLLTPRGDRIGDRSRGRLDRGELRGGRLLDLDDLRRYRPVRLHNRSRRAGQQWALEEVRGRGRLPVDGSRLAAGGVSLCGQVPSGAGLLRHPRRQWQREGHRDEDGVPSLPRQREDRPVPRPHGDHVARGSGAERGARSRVQRRHVHGRGHQPARGSCLVGARRCLVLGVEHPVVRPQFEGHAQDGSSRC